MASGERLDKSGHVGGSLLLYFGILYATGMRGDTIETLGLAALAATVAALMAVKQDKDNFLWGIFHRTWITHSLTTVVIVTGITYLAIDRLLPGSPIATYLALAVGSATLSHVLLDSMTKGGVPLLGPFDDKKRGLRWFKGNNVFVNWAFLAAGIGMAAYYFGLFQL
jgi:inner membrane protein